MKKRSPGDWVFDSLNTVFLLVIFVLMLYPMVHILMGSISDPIKMVAYKGPMLLPRGFDPRAYGLVLDNPNILSGYRNTLIVVVGATALNILMTSLGAYVLSRRQFALKKALMLMVVVTMYFGGGMIPRFLIFKNVYHIDNTFWALILPGAISTWNLIIMRTSFMGIPASLEESAHIDGANDFVILFRIIMPLAKATVAVMVLFYGVSHWNAWFDAMVFLRKRELYPLQLILRELLISQKQMAAGGDEAEMLAENLKYATIMVATLPILFIYPFIQRYFVKGVMVGAVKE